MLETEKLLILAVKKEDELMGFCVASVNGKIGEIDSL